ncbi:hypothetical protein [Amycolatopsis vastitatis]|uniref:Uncharacterized protein n=1 Tax=Amycolatopsis vastitatis TaxID=1905142 RepID=A0A229SR54_9PSEU|nr:hypothetical protein [Amycolatopsis vastitatis]OXM61376.1 hypothetical protein CF165_38530 [Amycolatopsis vastitatis]
MVQTIELYRPEAHRLVMDHAREGAEFARTIAPSQSDGYPDGIDADDGELGGERHDRPVEPGCRDRAGTA